MIEIANQSIPPPGRIKSILLMDNNDGNTYQVHALPEFHVIVIKGNGVLSSATLLELQQVLDAFEDNVLYDRFIFQLPEVNSDACFQLAAALEQSIFKCAFIANASLKPQYRERLFWYWCQHPLTEVAFLEALQLVGKFSVASILDDEAVDYVSFDEHEIT